MKKLRVIVLLVSLLSGAMAVKSQANDAQSDYARAVRSYVDAATDELRGIRGQVDSQVASVADAAAKKRFDAVFAKLNECDKVLVELKKAGPADFDIVKLRFEHARAAAVEALAKINKG